LDRCPVGSQDSRVVPGKLVATQGGCSEPGWVRRTNQMRTPKEDIMTTARDIMTGDATCVGAGETLVEAARKMSELDVGALPICGDDDRLKGMITDRDIVVKCIAQGGDPQSVKVGDLAEGKPVTIGADDSLEEALRTMTQHHVRRLPVIDGHTLVGIVSQADIAKNLPEERVGEFVEAISAAPANN